MTAVRDTTVVLVEGESDRVAIATLAVRLGRDLGAEGVAITAMGGAHGIEEHLRRLAGTRVAGLCDEGEVPVFRDALESTGRGTDLDRTGMAALGFHVCVADLEDELIRAVGEPAIERILERKRDLAAFRTMQHQPAWRGRPFEQQMRRWIGAGARRKVRYAEYLVEAMDMGAVPAPLVGLLTSIGS